MPLLPLVPSSWVLTTSTGSSVRASRRVAAGAGSGVRQVCPASFVGAPYGSLRIGRGGSRGAPPCEGFVLVGSRPASLRAAPLLPFIASRTWDFRPLREEASFRPLPARMQVRVGGGSPSDAVGRGVSSASSSARRASKHRYRPFLFPGPSRHPVPDPHARLPSRGARLASDRSGVGCVVGLSTRPWRDGETPQELAAFAVSVLLDLRSLPLAVSGSRCSTEDSLVRWLSGPPEILGIPGGSVVPSPSVDTRSGVSAGRLQGLAPPTSPGRSAGLATHGPPVPSLGLFPLRGFTRPTDGGSLRILRPPLGLPRGHPGPGFHSARLR
jgi:hypothetical protein